MYHYNPKVLRTLSKSNMSKLIERLKPFTQDMKEYREFQIKRLRELDL